MKVKENKTILHKDVSNEEEWVADCSGCGAKTKIGWQQALNNGCPSCCSYKISIYNQKNLQKEQPNREV